MTIKILVLEDNRESRLAIRHMIEQGEPESEIWEAETVEEGKHLLSEKMDFDLFFLDINMDAYHMEDIRGLEFARYLRSLPAYDFTPIVFITSLLSLELTAYREFQCYRYITKPFHEEEIQDIVKKVKEHQFHQERATEERETFLIKKDGVNFKIMLDEIVYAEAVPRGICLHMKSEDLSVKYMTLKQLLMKLPERDFLQCHRMFIINRRQVEYIDLVNRRVKLYGYDDWVEIGVTYKAKLKETFHG